jgi:hypothetical protein
MFDLGYELIRLYKWDEIKNGRPMGKAPIQRDWLRRRPLTRKEIIEWMKAGNNVGVRLGKTDLVIDVDPRNSQAGVDYSYYTDGLPIDYPTVRTPSGGLHIYMKKPADLDIRHCLPELPGIEFCTYGRQVVAPGSVHPNGGNYRLDELSAPYPTTEAPIEILDNIRKVIQVSEGGELEPAEIAELLMKLNVEDFRNHDDWFQLMCALHEASDGDEAAMDAFIQWSIGDPEFRHHENEIRRRWRSLTAGKKGNAGMGALRTICLEHGVPPPRGVSAAEDFDDLDDDEDHDLDASPMPKRNIMEEISEKYYCVSDQMKLRIFTKENDPELGRDYWAKCARKDFIEIGKSVFQYPDIIIKVPQGNKVIEKKIPAAIYWLDHYKKKKTFHGTTFDPKISGIDANGKLNLCMGFNVEPDEKKKWPKLKELLREYLCNGDEQSFRYVMDWLARMFQFPDDPARTAVVFHGIKGSGKGTFGRAVCDILGQTSMHITNSPLLTGRFNAHLRGCLFLLADEAFWARDKAAESVLKGLITEPMIAYEAKGANVEMGRNRIHVMMLSNNEFVVPAGMNDERRYAVFEVKKKPTDAFFTAVNAEIENGGLKAMLHELLNRDITKFNPHSAIPQTEALMEQKRQNLDLHDQWIYDTVMDAEDWTFPIVKKEDGYSIVISGYIRQSMLHYFKEAGVHPGSKAGSRSIGKMLRKYFPNLERRRIPAPAESLDISEIRPWAYVLPPIEEFQKRIREEIGDLEESEE